MVRKYFILEDGGGGEPTKPMPPKNYKVSTPQQRADWNELLDYVGKQPNVDYNSDLIGAYKKVKPNFSLSSQDLPNILYEQQQIRKGDSFGALDQKKLDYIRKGLPNDYLNKPTDNPYKLYYPQVSGYGTDLEGYYNSKMGVAAATPSSIVPSTPTKTLDTVALKKKYASNPYLSEQGRYNWGNKLENEFPVSGGKVKDAVVNAAKLNGIDPALLYGSAMEEGMSGAVDEKYSDKASEAYVNWAAKNKDKSGEYPVDGFFNYGLDQFADKAGDLEKKGYLPKGFSDKFTKFYAENEKGGALNAAAFKTDADALTAKSAMMKEAGDQLEQHLKKTGITLSPRQKEFFLLANYNGGEGNMRKMIQSYKEKGYLKDDKFLDTKFKPAAYGSIYKNVMARLESANQLRNEGFFK